MIRDEYQEIYDFWKANPCKGGNENFPFWMFKDMRVLEIGTGMGNDAKRFLKAGAKYTGIDLTPQGLHTFTNFHILQMNAEELDFPNDHFDLTYSFGVIHHTLRPARVIDEMLRVLKPGGLFCVMLYNKLSFRYLIEIKILRKILWHLHYWKYNEIRKKIPHPTKAEWISINTDNIGCPMSRAYTKKEVLGMFARFRDLKTWTERKGWFRIITGRK